ncbi:MAG: ATP-binding protein [Spirochaetes bacterium]|nr:ATP-binding protein [Spirochaetota bacterium]MCK5268601.1 ATP-binding protein [Spirochaetota bacterium]
MLPENVLYSLNPWWEDHLVEMGFLRTKYLERLNLQSRQITLIQGSRRIGKSTLLLQIADKLIQAGIDPKKILNISIDHALLKEKSIFSIIKAFRTLFSHPLKEKLYLLLDEVQDNPNWISEIKTIYDTENVHFFCTGSHTTLLDSEGSKLTGRYISLIMRPMDYDEYLGIKGISYSKAESYLHINEVKNYLASGGYPERVSGQNIDYLKTLLKDIIERDIRVRYKLKKHYLLEDLFRLIIKSTGSPISYQKMSKILKTTDDTLKEYVYLFKKCFLINTCSKWTWSENERIYNPDKIYPIDTAFLSLDDSSPDLGKKAELAVFNSLLQKDRIGYYKINGFEVDFASGSFEKITLIESKFRNDLTLSHKSMQAVSKALTRDEKGVIKSVKVITDMQEGEESFQGVNFEYIPLWKWLLGTSH